MQIDSNRIRTERERRAWSQEHLAEVAGLSLRTVQRIESTGAASFETTKALASVFELDVATLAAPVRSVRRRPAWIAIAASLVAALCGVWPRKI
jgi:transcriptional regulator with XRE-family HTH domain